ncbi:MAG: hypothetical protein JOY90_36890 [Bradyrhizobium sp.]|nr:hypothetical protein [Bradyrhizobium sp.]
MRRVSDWFRLFLGARLLGSRFRRVSAAPLPLSTDEFARLIASGRPDDMKLLAKALSRSAILPAD